MNREEIIIQIQDKLNKAYMLKDREEADRIIKSIFDDVDKLRQPITLAEFLDWEENEIYTCFANQYSIKNDELCFLNYKNEWCQACSYQELMDIKQQAKKVKPKKYYLKLKSKYNEFLCRYENETYINFDLENDYFLDSKDDFDDCKTQFTDKEIKNIKLPEPLTLDMFEKIEVE